MNNNKEKFIIDIVPLTRIPLTRNQSFSYLHDKKLSSGTLVSVPLFKRKVEGVVLESRDDFERLGNIELKRIEKVIEENFLDSKQIELAKFISDYYISPLGIVMKNFVPERVKSRNREQRTVNNKSREIILTKEQESAVEEITKSYKLKAKSYLLFGPAGSGKTEVYIHSILKLRQKDPDLQALILVPEQTLTPQAIERYGAYFGPSEVVVMSSNVSKGQYFSNWLKIASGEAKIVIGTRMACFAPFKNLGLVVIDEEQDMSYKQWDMNPRYDARLVAEKLAEIHNSSIIRGSATPSVESYYRVSKKELQLIKMPELNLDPSPVLRTSSPKGREGYSLDTKYKIPDTTLVDMKKERWAKNYSPISKKLKAEIEYALKNKLQTILLINRQGMSSFSVCEACKTVLKCPKCDRALVYDEKGHYRCVHCAYKTSIAPKCAKCGSIIFKNIGLGTQKVEREINYLFPGAKTARIDSQAIREKNYQERIYQDFSNKKIDILIGTQMITKGWDLPNVSLVGIIDVDNMLSMPDFSVAEKAYQLINQAAGRVNRPGASWPGVVVIQTFNPENKLMKLIAGRDFDSFFEQEMAGRKALKLPPFGKIIKLTNQDYNKNRGEKSAKNIYELLKKTSKNISISEPQAAFVSKIRGRFRHIILIKLKGNKIPSETVKVLKSLPSEWIVDVDPISIL